MDAMVCPHCNCPDCGEEENYCYNCGRPLHNYCLDPNCPNSEKGGGLRPTDVFCPCCGANSRFLREGYIEPRQFDP